MSAVGIRPARQRRRRRAERDHRRAARRHRRHGPLGDRARPAGRAHPADRGDARRRARAAADRRASGSASAAARCCSASSCCSSGCSAASSNGIAFVGLGALLVFVGAFVLSPLFARGVSLIIGAPLAEIKGIDGHARPRERGPEPEAHRDDRAALIIGVALVGFITIFAASAKASISARDRLAVQDRLHHQGPGGFGARRRAQPDARRRQIAALPEIEAATAVAARRGRHQRQPRRSSTRSTRSAADAALRPRRRRRLVRRRSSDNGIAVSKRKADDNHWKLGDDDPGHVREDRRRSR